MLLLGKLICFVTRRFSSFRGRWFIIRRLMGCDNFLKALGSREVRVRNVGVFLLDPYEHIGRYLYIHGEYEPEISSLFEELVVPGWNIIDIGANIGFFSILGAKLVGDRGRVVSFEASPYVFRTLKRNIDLNSPSNIDAFNLAVLDKPGRIQFHLSKRHNQGLSSLRNLGDETEQVVETEGISIDSMLTALPKISLVKIDVEGAEVKVILGAIRMLRRDRPYLILEWADSLLVETGNSSGELFDILSRERYSLFSVNSGLVKISACDIESLKGTQANVLAIPGGALVPKAIERQIMEFRPSTST